MGVLLYFLQGGNSYFPLLTLGWSLGSGGAGASGEGCRVSSWVWNQQGGGHSWRLGGPAPRRQSPKAAPAQLRQDGG